MDRYLKKYLFLLAVALVSLLAFHLNEDKHNVYSLVPPTSKHWQTFYNQDSLPSSIKTHFDSVLRVDFTLNSPTENSAWVIVQFDLWRLNEKHLNWMFADSLYLDLHSQDLSELQVKILTFDPDVSTRREYATYKILTKEISLTKGRQRVGIALEDFYIPEWWFAQWDPQRKLTQKHWEKVGYLEISTTEKAPLQQPLSYAIHDISVQKAQKTYLKILLGVLFILVIIAIGLLPNPGQAKRGNTNQ